MDKAGHVRLLTIMVIYDSEGIIEDYVIYYLRSIKRLSDRVIAVINGCLTREGKSKLETIVSDIYIRENKGFDFGAYKEVISKYLNLHEVFDYQELLLCNDTCFGPLIPFEEIFSKMDDDTLDFWSMNYIDDRLLPHFQSYFMVFRNNARRLLVDFLDKEVDERTTEIIQAHGYEHALSEAILSSGLNCDYYTSKACCHHDIDIYGAPDHAINDLGLPMVKKKVFSGEFCRRENAQEALRVIADTKKYPVEYILEYVRRVYKKEYQISLYHSATPVFSVWRNYTRREDVIKYCQKHEKIYVYGNGYMSVLFMARFRRYMKQFGGYIVSDEYYRGDWWNGESIYPLSSIDMDVPIIVALMEKSAKQVANRLCNRPNVLFLSIK